jgi:hypothetical protein
MATANAGLRPHTRTTDPNVHRGVHGGMPLPVVAAWWWCLRAQASIRGRHGGCMTKKSLMRKRLRTSVAAREAGRRTQVPPPRCRNAAGTREQT